MAKKRIFSLDPDQLGRLLSMGTGAEEPAKSHKHGRHDDDTDDASCDKTPGKKVDPHNAGASISLAFEQPGDQIGPYKLLRILGEGGMGIAYLAEQAQPIKRQVALKVIKPGMDTVRVVARFEAERQALALLDHPNIAHIHEAGTTKSGRPYFAMEYVDGFPITEHCDRHKLTIEERLRLFLQVCHAVHHAHQKGIIHRDIKPSNILVSFQDDQAVPKIIDFGVAKAVSQTLTERTLYTEQGQLFGTPEYMSPEQADMANKDIDTRSDIYSLGVLLYVLLTGVLPFDAKDLRKGGVEHIRHVIRETDPKTPSARVTKLGESAKKIAQSRQTKIEILTRRLHKELEWIPLKAMRKEPTERYRSVSELTDDIENYLDGKPLIAGPPSTAYLAKKFVRRNRALVAGIAVVLTVLVAGITISTSFAIRARHARDEAQTVSDFLQSSVLGSLNLWHIMGKERTVHSILDEVSQELDGKFQEQPLVEASIRQALASAYGVGGLFKPAELHARRALEIRRTHLGDENIATLYSWFQLGWVYMLQCRCDKARELLTKALAGFEITLDEAHSDRLFCMSFLGWVYNYQGHFSEAEEILSKALAAAHRDRGAEDSQALYLRYCLARTHQFQGHYKEAESLYVKGLEVSGRVLTDRHDATLMLKHGLGSLRWAQGRYAAAEKLLSETLTSRCETWSEEHPRTLITMADLGLTYYSQGRYPKAEDLLLRALEIQERVVGRKHFETALSMDGLAAVYLSQGRYDEAEALLTDEGDIIHRTLGEKSWATLRLTNTLARLCTAKGAYGRAESLLQKVLETRRRILIEDHPDTLQTINDLGVLHREQGDYPEAEELLGKALAGRQRKLGNDHPACFESMHEMALSYRLQNRYGDAEKMLLEALKGRHLKLGGKHPHTLESLNNIIDLYEAWNKPDKTEEWRAKLSQTENMK